jgi:hypothetical protein
MLIIRRSEGFVARSVLALLMSAFTVGAVNAQASNPVPAEPKATAPPPAAPVDHQATQPPEAAACTDEVDAQKKSAAEFANTINNFNEQNPPGVSKPQACIGGTIRWERTSWKMDLPEVTMKRVEWKMDVPETWLGQQEWWVKEPIVVCEDKKVGQYPQTTGTDTWIEAFGIKTKGIPSCTVSWHDIITKICWPETRDKKIVLGVPEFKMTTRTLSMDVPEVTMKTRELSLHLPQFFAESGCLGADCADKCKNELNGKMEALNKNRDAKTGPAKQALITSLAAMYKCQTDGIGIQRDFALAQYDKFITVAEATLKAMRAQGLDNPAAEQATRIGQMRAEREKIRDDLDKVIAKMRDDEKKAVETLGG